MRYLRNRMRDEDLREAVTGQALTPESAAFSPVSMGVKVCIFVRDPRAIRR
jgi:hypothetical protein